MGHPWVTTQGPIHARPPSTTLLHALSPITNTIAYVPPRESAPCHQEPNTSLLSRPQSKNQQLEGPRVTWDRTSRPHPNRRPALSLPASLSLSFLYTSTQTHRTLPPFGFRNLAHRRFPDRGHSLRAKPSTRPPRWALPACHTACVCTAAQALPPRTHSCHHHGPAAIWPIVLIARHLRLAEIALFLLWCPILPVAVAVDDHLPGRGRLPPARVATTPPPELPQRPCGPDATPPGKATPHHR